MTITLDDYISNIATNLEHVTTLNQIVIRDVDKDGELLIQARIKSDIRYSTAIKNLVKSCLDASAYRVEDVITGQLSLDPNTAIIHVTERKPGFTPTELVDQINNIPGFFDKNPIEIITNDMHRYIITGISSLGNQNPKTHRLCLTGELIADESRESTDGR